MNGNFAYLDQSDKIGAAKTNTNFQWSIQKSSRNSNITRGKNVGKS